MGARVGPRVVVLDVGVDSLEGRVELGREAEEDHVPLEARQAEEARQQLDRRRSAAVALGSRVQLPLERGQLLADGRCLWVVGVEAAFVRAAVGEELVGLGVAHEEPAVLLQGILAPAAPKPERAPLEQQAHPAQLPVEIGAVCGRPRGK